MKFNEFFCGVKTKIAELFRHLKSRLSKLCKSIAHGISKILTVIANAFSAIIKFFIKKFFLIFACACLVVALGVLAINIYIIQYSKPYIYQNISDLPQTYVAILPGAKVYSNNVSHVVHDRIDAGLNVVNNNKAQRILISGDHGQKRYDEVNQMKNFMLKYYDVQEDIIFLDHAGFSTYETMYRARDIFCVKDAVVVTQKFHCARSVYIARKLGLDVVALEAPALVRYAKRTRISWEVRESLARVKSFFLVLFNAKPTYLGEQIPITGEANLSWD